MSARKRRRSPWLYAIPVAVLLAAGGWYYYSQSSASQEVTYQTARVTRGDLQTSISSAGTIQPRETVEVGAQVSGQLEALYVEEGDVVEEGFLLAQIDATIAENNVASQRAQLKELRASRAQQVATLELAQSEAKRAETLFQADAISRAEYESTLSTLKIADARLTAIDAQIESQTSSLNADMAELEYTKIYAPVSGTIVTLAATEGQTLNANQTAPTILTISDLTDMTVQTDVSEADVNSVRAGQKAYFTTLGDPGRKWDTEVRLILPEPEIVNDVVLYKALLDIANPDGLLRTSMTTQVFFITGETEDALLVPVTALQDMPAGGPPTAPTGGQKAASDQSRQMPPGMIAFEQARKEHPDASPGMVMIMQEDGTPRPQPVLVGLKTRTKAEIIYGLKEGQTIITGQVNPSVMAPRTNSSRSGPPGGFAGRPPGPR